jgi:hypothetical protein
MQIVSIMALINLEPIYKHHFHVLFFNISSDAWSKEADDLLAAGMQQK